MEPKENINFIFQLNNKNRSTNFFLLFISSGVVFMAIAFYFVAINRTIDLLFTTLLAIGYFVLFSKIKPSFFELLVTDDRMQVNFYSVSSTFRNYQSIEIYLHQLKNFHVKQQFGGLVKQLILSVESKYGLADYPPVSISILTKKERSQLLLVLQEIVNNNQKT